MSLNISLIDNWSIRSDSKQFILCRTSNGRDFFEGFYPTLQDLLDDFVLMKIRTFDSTDIVSLIKKIKSLQAALSKCLYPLDLEVSQKND